MAGRGRIGMVRVEVRSLLGYQFWTWWSRGGKVNMEDEQDLQACKGRHAIVNGRIDRKEKDDSASMTAVLVGESLDALQCLRLVGRDDIDG